MNAAVAEKKSTLTLDKKSTAVESAAQPAADAVSTNSLQNSIDKLDAEIKEKLTSVIENLAPGNASSFSPSVIKEISKIENRKNRLIAGRLERLLREGNPEAKEIVERLLAIAI
jgi:hypothetical protein